MLVFGLGHILGIHLEGGLTVGDFLVGTGTLALAAFTARLARYTKGQVVASRQEIRTAQESLEVARQSIEVIDMPLVIPTPQPELGAISITRSGDRLAIRFWNVGRGPAFVSDVQLRLGDNEILTSLENYIPIATGQGADVELRLRGPVSSLIRRGELSDKGTLRVFYNHASATSYMTLAAVRRVEMSFMCRHLSRHEPDVDQRPLVDLEP